MINRKLLKRHRTVATSSSTDSTKIFHDDEFGDIPYRRLAKSQHVRISVGTNGQLKATMPTFAPIGALRNLVDQSRTKIRTMHTKVTNEYHDGQRVGHSHTIVLLPNMSEKFDATINNQKIVISYPQKMSIDAHELQTYIRGYVSKALRVESRAYLPRRLEYIAQHGTFHYERVRFAHQSSRWGSCSSNGTISLNIALMNLPLELIDYVLVHELAHTRQMNHSTKFWEIVATHYPLFKAARRQLKTYNPYI